MDQLFGKTLRALMETGEIKESELADALSYDATYISKWVNGSKLPSARNVEKIIGQIADFFVERGGDENTARAVKQNGKPEIERQRIIDALQAAYDKDSSYQVFQNYNNSQMSFIDSQQMLVQLTRDALMLALKRRTPGKGADVTITATFDLFRLYGKAFNSLIKELHEASAEKVEMNFAVNPEDLKAEEYFYATGILNSIGSLDYVEMTIVRRMEDQPRILVIDDFLCLQILWDDNGQFAAVFSMDEKIIVRFVHMCKASLGASEKLLVPANPDKLKQTNVQIDSYSDTRQWLFFNESPALLFPEDIMDAMIEDAEDENYANYLLKLKATFAKRTCNARIDLVLYSSVLNQYIFDGKVSVGNVSHTLTEAQTHNHIRYLSEIMKRNPNFNLYLIRDTVVFREELRKSPSIFIDTLGLYIENSKKQPNNNFHISMDPCVRNTLQTFFETMLTQSYCKKLTAEDLLLYI